MNASIVTLFFILVKTHELTLLTIPFQASLAELIRDIDLSIPGENEDVYEKQTRVVKLDYSHVEDAVFYPQRAKIPKMLKKEMTFETRHFTQLNEKAQHISVSQAGSNQISSSRPS